jgi:hypothetical protein
MTWYGSSNTCQNVTGRKFLVENIEFLRGNAGLAM